MTENYKIFDSSHLFDHQIQNEFIVPASSLLLSTNFNHLSNIVFLKKLNILDCLNIKSEASKYYAINNNNEKIFTFEIVDSFENNVILFEQTNTIIECDQFYSYFQSNNYTYKSAFKTVSTLHTNAEQTFAKVILKGNNLDAILDGALQAIVYLQKQNQTYIPFYIKSFHKYIYDFEDDDTSFIGFVTKEGNLNIKSSKTNKLIFTAENCYFKQVNNYSDIKCGISSYAFRLPNGINNMDKLYDLLSSYSTTNKSSGRLNYPANYLDEDISLFDSTFFNMPKSEATRTDPQHRLLLETVYECLENRGLIRNKGVETERLGFFIGFMGSEFNEYADEDSLSMIGQTNSAISGRLNHFFKSFGPSVVIDTACSSGLVALDCALKAIKNGDCNKAIVASVGLIISDRGMKQRINARLLSKDGRCYSFLEKASGYGRSEGCVALLIEKLNDSCEVEIVSCVTNHCGGALSLTTPSEISQRRLLKKVICDVKPNTMQYYEAHGTGTKIGDPLELRALDEVLVDQKCYVGTVKSNIGHSEAVSGLCGILKVILQMKRNILFGIPDLMIINKEVELSNIKLVKKHVRLNVTLSGISSFGLSGVNAMAVLKKHPNNDNPKSSTKCGIIVITGHTTLSLNLNVEIMEKYLKDTRSDFSEIALTSIFKRKHYKNKCVILRNSILLYDKTDIVLNLNQECSINIDVGYNKLECLEDLIRLLTTISSTTHFEVYAEEENVRNLIKLYNLKESSVKGKNIPKSIEELEYFIGQLFVNGCNINFEEMYKIDWKLGSIVRDYPSYQFDRLCHWPDKILLNEEDTLPKLSYYDDLKIVIMHEIGHDFEIDSTFLELGFDSLGITTLLDHFNGIKGMIKLELDDLFRYPTIRKLDGCIIDRMKVKPMNVKEVKPVNVEEVKSMKVVESNNESIENYFYFPTSLKQNKVFNCIVEYKIENIKSKWILDEQIHDAFAKYVNVKVLIEIVESSNLCMNWKELFNCLLNLYKKLKEITKLNKKVEIYVKDSSSPLCHMLNSFLKTLVAEEHDSVVFGKPSKDLRKYSDGTKKIDSPKWSKNEAWLITGGTSGIGLEIAKWIENESHEDTSIYLISRTHRRIDNNKSKFIQINGEIGDYIFVQNVIKQIVNSGKFLKGVLHNAGTLQDSLISNQSVDSFDKVFNSKVIGLQNIETALSNFQLDPEYFICNSSIASIFGNKGQANYSAANGFCNGAMIDRVKRSCKSGISICWGNWLETGMASKLNINTHLQKAGLLGLTTKNSLLCFEKALTLNEPIVIIANIDWKLFIENRSDLIPLTKNTAKEIKNDDVVPHQSYEQSIKNWIKTKFTLLSDNDIEEKNFYELGLDSLFLHEFVEELKVVTSNTTLKVIDLFEYTTVHKLARFLDSTDKKEILNKKLFKEGDQIFFENHIFHNKAIAPGMLQITNISQQLQCFKFKNIRFIAPILLENINLVEFRMIEDGSIIIYNIDTNVIYTSVELNSSCISNNSNQFENVSNFIINETSTFYNVLKCYGFEYGDHLKLLNVAYISPDKNCGYATITLRSWMINEAALQLLAFICFKKFADRHCVYLPVSCESISFNNSNNEEIECRLKCWIDEKLDDEIIGSVSIYLSNDHCVNISTITRLRAKVFLVEKTNLPIADAFCNVESTTLSSIKSANLFGREDLANRTKSSFSLDDLRMKEFDADLIRKESNKSLKRLMIEKKFSISEGNERFTQPKKDKIYIKRCAIYLPEDLSIKNIHSFDNEFFKMSMKEAIYLDPQQKLLLELSAEALIDIELKNNTGVFIGSCSNDFALKCFKNSDKIELSKFVGSGTNQNMLAGRISNFFNLQGPSISLDTACSSFMSALTLACDYIYSGRISSAIVGSANIIINEEPTNVLKNSNMISSRNLCCPLDNEADGYIRNQCVSIFYIEKEEHSNYPEIVGWNLNHSGGNRAIGVPNTKSEENAMKYALEKSKLEVDDIDVLEIHGSGTQLGDVLEMQAVSNVFNGKLNKLFITASKGKYGHCEGSAGSLALFQMLKMMQANKVFAIKNFKKLNQKIELNNKIVVCDKTINVDIHLGMVNCFGFSGTNGSAIIKTGTSMPFVERISWKKHNDCNLFKDGIFFNTFKVANSKFDNKASTNDNSEYENICINNYDEFMNALDIISTHKYINFITLHQNNGLKGLLATAKLEGKIQNYRVILFQNQILLQTFNWLSFNQQARDYVYYIVQDEMTILSEQILPIKIKIEKEKCFNKILVTGSNGGLAQEILKQFSHNYAILISKSPCNHQLKENQEFFQTCISSYSKVKFIFEKNQDIDCIIHCAGVIQNKMILNITREDFEKTIQPKCNGIQKLIENCKKLDNLKTFIAISSVAALHGSVGQANYSYANELMSSTLMNADLKKTQCLVFDLGPLSGDGMLYKNILNMDKIRQQVENGPWKFTNISCVVNNIKTIVNSSQSGRFALFEKNELIKEIVVENETHLSNYEKLKNIIAKLSGSTCFDKNRGFMELGFDSIMLESLRDQVSKSFDFSLNIENLFEYSNFTHLLAHIESQIIPKNCENTVEDKIAIISYQGTFSGAENVNIFFENLILEKESFESNNLLQLPNFVNVGGVIPNYNKFDINFMELPSEVVTNLDPQIKHFVHQSKKTLDKTKISQNAKIGVIATAEPSEFINKPNKPLMGNLMNLFEKNQKDFVALWTAYLLNLTGPSFNVYSACSSSILALKQASYILLNNEAEYMLVGGVSLLDPLNIGHQHEKGLMMSNEGHCKPFHPKATGIIRGSGCGIVLLKKLKNAIADGDIIYGVLEGVAINNDGSHKSNFLAPNMSGQEEVMREVLLKANLDPGKIDYLECHCTGTVVGDKIELAAIKRVFNESSFNGLIKGSVKANIGHLFAASGIASLIKLLEIIRLQKIPKQLHIENNFDTSKYLKYLMVNNFGIGGTNGCLIVSNYSKTNTKPIFKNEYVANYEKAKSLPISKQPLLFPFSAKNKYELEDELINFKTYLKENETDSFMEIWNAIVNQNKNLNWRCCLAADSLESLIYILESKNYKCHEVKSVLNNENIAFYCAPQGVEYKKIGDELMCMPTFEKCIHKFKNKYSVDVYDKTFMENINKTTNAQVAIFTVSYAVCKTLSSYGIEPNLIFGHSVGEFTALTIAGFLPKAETIKILKKRGILMEQTIEATMYAIKGPNFVTKFNEFHDSGVEICAILNDNLNCVVGTAINLTNLKIKMPEFEWKKIRSKHGFHSSMMDSILPAFKQYLNKMSWSKNFNKKVISNVNGKYVQDIKMDLPDYFIEHARQPVRLDLSIRTLKDRHECCKIIFEIGPQGMLKNIILNENFVLLNTIQGHAAQLQKKENILIKSIAQAWCLGYNDINFKSEFNTENIKQIDISHIVSSEFTFWAFQKDSKVVEKCGNDIKIVKEEDLDEMLSNKSKWICQQNSKIYYNVKELNTKSVMLVALLSEIQNTGDNINVTIDLGYSLSDVKCADNGYLNFQYDNQLFKYQKIGKYQDDSHEIKSILIFGASGCVGKIFEDICISIYPGATIYTASLHRDNLDVRNYQNVFGFIENILKENNTIDIIINCVGLHPSNPTKNDILTSKIEGISNILKVIEYFNINVYKLILISSISSFLGIANNLHYAASNIFSDLFSLEIHQKIDHILSLQLPAILCDSSMVYRNMSHSELESDIVNNGISSKQLKLCLTKLLRTEISGIVALSKFDPSHIRNYLSEKQALNAVNIYQNYGNTDNYETLIREAWFSVLNKYPNSHNANFFEDGGDSLSALQFIWKLHQNYTLDVLYDQPYFHQIIRNYTQFICKGDNILIERSPNNTNYLLHMTHSQKGMALLHQISPQGLYNIIFEIKLYVSSANNELSNIINKLIKYQCGLRVQFDIKTSTMQLLSLTECFFYLEPTKYSFEDVKNIINFEKQFHFSLFEVPLRIISYELDSNLCIVINQHHIMTDGWSMSVFAKSFSNIWNNKESEHSFNICSTNITMATDEYISTQIKSLLISRPCLESVANPTRIFSIQNNNSLKFDSIKCHISKCIRDNMDAFCRKHQITPFIFNLACFVILVECYNDTFDSDFLFIGVPVSGRKTKECENVIGCFLNNIVIIIDRKKLKLYKNDNFRIINYVKEEYLNAKKYEDIPFSELVMRLNLQNKNKSHPLFEIFFNYRHDLDFPKIQLDDGTKTTVRQITNNKVFDFSFTIDKVFDNLQFLVNFNKSKYSHSFIKQIIEYYVSILQSILGQTPQLKSVDSKFEDTPNLSIQQILHKQCHLTKYKNISFEKIYQLSVNVSNQYFQTFGEMIFPDTPIAISPLLNNNLNLLLGVLLTGSAYVMIPGYLMTQDVTKEMLLITSLKRNINFMNFFRNKNAVNDLCYGMFTSGTTSKSKLVLIDQISVLNFVLNATKDFHINETSLIANNISFTFDISIFNIFATICNGSKLLNSTSLLSYDASSYQTLDVTHFLISSAVFNTFTPKDLELFKKMKCLKHFIVGGETPLSQILEEFNLNNIKCTQIYGPTECTVWILRKFNSLQNTVIGKPISNTKVFIENKNLEKNVKFGEIVVEGSCILRGYYNSLESFNKFYTGDLVQLLDDGNFQYLGRVEDNFIKFKGIRINVPYLQNKFNAVILKVSESLIAFVKKDKMDKNYNDLKNEVDKIVIVDSYPLNINGKIDKQALLDQTKYSGDTRQPYQADGKLLKIWNDLLPMAAENMSFNFFEDGGNSLLLVMLKNKIQSEFNVELDGSELYKYNSIEQINKLILSKKAVTTVKTLKLLKNSSIAIYLFFPIGGNLFSYYCISQFFDCQIYGFEYENECCDRSLVDLAKHYSNFINLKENKKVVLMGSSFGGILAREVYLALKAIKSDTSNLSDNIIMFDSWAMNNHELKIDAIKEYLLEKFVIFPNKDALIQKSMILANMLKDHIFTKDSVASNLKIILIKAKNIGSSALKHTFLIEPLDLYIRSCNDNGFKQYVKEIEVILADGDHDSILSINNIKTWIHELEEYIPIKY